MTARSRREVVVCFHGVGRPDRELEDGEEPYWIDERLFAAVLDVCATRDDVWVTFDDGNASDVDIALPLLLARRLRASFFPIAARIDQRGSLSAAALRELTERGMTVGTHGMHHRSWRGLAAQELRVELQDAAASIGEASGAPVTEAACPFGLYDRASLRALRRAGFERVYTSDRAPGRSKQWLQPRYSVCKSDSAQEVAAWLRADGAALRARAAARIQLKSWR